MKPFPTKAFWAVVIAQLLVLSFMITKRVTLLKTGKMIRLECQPVDPRSLFSGDYVILNYKISSLQKNFHKLNLYQETFKKHDTLYVALEKKKSSLFWKAIAVSHDRKKLSKIYPVLIRGVLKSTYNYRVRYGVESYFVPQFEGKRIERHLRDASVSIALSKSGESAIKTLYIANKPVHFQ